MSCSAGRPDPQPRARSGRCPSDLCRPGRPFSQKTCRPLFVLVPATSSILLRSRECRSVHATNSTSRSSSSSVWVAGVVYSPSRRVIAGPNFWGADRPDRALRGCSFDVTCAGESPTMPICRRADLELDSRCRCLRSVHENLSLRRPGNPSNRLPAA